MPESIPAKLTWRFQMPGQWTKKKYMQISNLAAKISIYASIMNFYRQKFVYLKNFL